jgi:hypothetical protein
VLFLPVLLMILFQQKYPRWWYDWNLQLTRFSNRIAVYLALMEDRYPSTDEQQAVQLDFPHPDVERDLGRGMPIVKWLLAIPHYLALLGLGIGALFVVIISFFAVLFTGRYPEGMFNYMVGVHRWGVRVGAYVLLMVDPYPPFTLDDDPSYPASFDIEYPEHVERWRPLLTWLLVIPFAIVAYFVILLAEIMSFFAFFTILFTRQFPEGLFNIARIGLRWQARSNAYTYWLVTRYPPFVWD